MAEFHQALKPDLYLRFSDQTYEIIVCTKPRQPLTLTQMGRDSSYTNLSGPLPVGIDQYGKTSCHENFARLISGKSNGFGNLYQLVNQPDVSSIDEICTVDSRMKQGARSLCLGPFTQFLSKSAVERA